MLSSECHGRGGNECYLSKPFVCTGPQHWSFPYIEEKFGEFGEFRESDKSPRHELGSI